MKKFYYSLFTAATMLLATTSCSQEEDFVQESSSEKTTFSVSLNGKAGSRAAETFLGDGTKATNLYYEVYRGDECILDNYKNSSLPPVSISNKTATIEMPLLKGETYDIIFWAQSPDGTIYKIDDLRSISIDYANTTLNANQESYDAFYNALEGFEADGKSHTIELRRPFAQLNLGTDDWSVAMNGLTEDEKKEGPVTHTSVTVVGLADTFSPLTGVASASTEGITKTFELNTIPEQEKLLANNKEYKYLSLNYLLIPNEKKPQGDKEYKEESSDAKANVDLTFALYRGETKKLFEIKVPNAPVQRNWRTNVVGSLLTGSKFEIIIDADFDDAYNHDAQAILKEVLTNGGELTLFSDVTLTENLTIPEGVEVTINLDGHELNAANANAIIVGGKLNIDNGTIRASSTTEGSHAFEVKKNATLNIGSETTIVAGEGAAAGIYMVGGSLDMEGTIEADGYQQAGIFIMTNGSVDVNIDGAISAENGYAIMQQGGTSNVAVSEASEMDKSMLGAAGTMNLTYYCETQPQVDNDGTAVTLNVVKRNKITLEGIYQNENGKKDYYVTSAEGLQNLNQLLSTIDLGEGKGATINMTADIDLAGKNWTPLEGMWVTFNGNGHTIKNMTVSAVSRAAENIRKAGFYGYAGAVTINDLTIENADVTGSQAGIFAGSGEGLKINNCFLKGTNKVTWAATIETWNGIGAITGVLISSTVDVTIVEGTTVTLDKSDMTTELDCTYIDNLTGYFKPNNGKVTNNGKVIVPSTASSTEELKNVLNSGANNITLPKGDYTLPTLSGKEGVTIIGDENGGTVIGGDNQSNAFYYQNFGKNTTIKNVTFSGSTNGVRYSYANGGTSTFDNCTFAGGSTYGFHIDQSNGATFIFNNCTFSGFNAFAGDLVSVTFNNCTFENNGNYGHTNIWSVAYFNNCTWGDNTSVSPSGNDGKLYFNGEEESYHHEFIGSAESLFAFAKSVNEGGNSWKGQKIVLVKDIDLNNEAWTPIGQTGATQFKGIFDGKNHTIKNLTIDSLSKTGGHYSSGLFGWAESGITIKNLKVDGASVIGNHNVAVIVGYTYSGIINNCHVTNAELTCTHVNDDACGDKAGIIGGYVGDESKVTDCSASNSKVTAGRDAGQLIGCGYNSSISGCKVTNVTVSATGDCTGANVRSYIIGRVMD